MNLDIQGAMKRFSGAIIKPVMFLAVAGILLAVSVILKMEGMPEPVVMLGQLIYTCVNSGVVGNLGLIFCIGLTCALANKRAGDAAVIAASTFLVFLYANNAWLTNNGMLIDPTGGLYGTGQGVVLGIQVVDMGVFIGIILGCLNGWVFNKFCDTKFPEVFSTYGGTKFVFLIAIFIAGALGIVMCYVWPVVNGWINGLQDFMYGTGYAGQFVYGFLNKLLIPTGMHHLLWMPFMYSAVGGTAQIAGEAYAGSYNIFMAELGNASAITAMDPSIRFSLLGFGKWFGTVGTVLAFISVAKPQHRAQVRAMLVPAALVALPAGLSQWFMVIPVGLVAIAVWFFVFRFLILKLNLVTPGREDEDEKLDEVDGATPLASGVSPESVQVIIDGLGGAANIKKVMNCFTRLRVDVEDMSLVDEDKINEYRNSGIVHGGPNNIQIVIGLKVQDVTEAVKVALGMKDE